MDFNPPIYSGSIGYDDEHIQIADERYWLRNAAESRRFFDDIDTTRKKEVLERLTAVETFEKFLHKTFIGEKRFSIEGTDILVPKLDEVIRSEVQVRVGTNDLPLRVSVSLQTMIQEWEPARQDRAFEEKMHELELLRPRVAPGLTPLVDEYHRVLLNYLQRQKNRKKAPSRQLVTQTVMELNALDLQRASVKPPPPLPLQNSKGASRATAKSNRCTNTARPKLLNNSRMARMPSV